MAGPLAEDRGSVTGGAARTAVRRGAGRPGPGTAPGPPGPAAGAGRPGSGRPRRNRGAARAPPRYLPGHDRERHADRCGTGRGHRPARRRPRRLAPPEQGQLGRPGTRPRRERVLRPARFPRRHRPSGPSSSRSWGTSRAAGSSTSSATSAKTPCPGPAAARRSPASTSRSPPCAPPAGWPGTSTWRPAPLRHRERLRRRRGAGRRDLRRRLHRARGAGVAARPRPRAHVAASLLRAGRRPLPRRFHPLTEVLGEDGSGWSTTTSRTGRVLTRATYTDGRR